VIEYWSELVASERHRKFQSDTIAALEQRREAMTDAAEVLGVFTALNVPERTGPTWSQRSKVASSTGRPAKQSRG
jgi:hypothetical protein